MSFICQVGVGYFDLAVPRWQKRFAPHRRVTTEDVSQLQAICNEVFQTSEVLEEHLIEPGLLLFQAGQVTRSAYQVACAAHELLGMVAVDFAHQDVLFPRTEWHVLPFEELLSEYRETMSHRSESEILEDARSMHDWERGWHVFQHETIKAVRDYQRRSRG